MQKTPKLEAAGPSQRLGDKANPEQAKPSNGPKGFSLLKNLVLRRRINEDIMEILVHAAKRLAIMNQHMADRSNFIIEVQSAPEVEERAHILQRITDL